MNMVLTLPEIPLATYVQNRRSELCVSQSELSRRSGLSTGWIGRLETGTIGQNPSLDTLKKLAKGLKVPLDTLIAIARDEEPKPAEPKPSEPGEMRSVIEGLSKRYEPTEDEWAVIDELDRIGTWHGGFSQPGFWELPPDERADDFFYLKGLIREYKKRHGATRGRRE